MAVLAKCPFCHKKQSVKNKLCKCGSDLIKLKRSDKVKYWITYRLPGSKQKFEKISGEQATSLDYVKDAEAKRKVQKRENRIFELKAEAKMTFLRQAIERLVEYRQNQSASVYQTVYQAAFGRQKGVSQISANPLN